MSELKDVKVTEISVGKYDIRMDEEGGGMDELAMSIGKIGLINPIRLSEDEDGYVLVAGHRRLAACIALGMKTVPAIIDQANQVDETDISFAENLFRRNLTPIELACAMNDCLVQGDMSVEEIARSMARSTEWVRRHVAMLTWPTDVQQAVHEGVIKVAAASNLALVDDDEYRAHLLRHARMDGATARLTAAWLQTYRALQPVERAVESEPVQQPSGATPLVPQAPCICCSDVFRADELCHVPICGRCVKALRDAKAAQEH